jgi:hypothetical protein
MLYGGTGSTASTMGSDRPTTVEKGIWKRHLGMVAL